MREGKGGLFSVSGALADFTISSNFTFKKCLTGLTSIFEGCRREPFLGNPSHKLSLICTCPKVILTNPSKVVTLSQYLNHSVILIS